MRRISLAGLMTAAVVSLVFVACGDPYGEEHDILGQYEHPLVNADGTKSCTNPKKVLICHVPPGNPANARAICVGSPAKEAHLAHGDLLGDCVATDGGTTAPTDGGSGGPSDGGSAPSPDGGIN